MRGHFFLLAVTTAVSISCHAPLFAAALTTTVIQPNADDSHWNAPIWEPGPVSPAPGDTCEVFAGARLRTPNGTLASGGTGAVGQTFTFPGDSLQLDGIGFSTSGTGELRVKHTFDNTTFAFPGVGGNAGLILNGGMINDGDNRRATISGLISVSAGTVSSINPGGQAITNFEIRRGFILDATLIGSGDLSLDYATDITSAGALSPALLVNSSNPNFTGDWIINSGWIRGAGVNSLGFGDITVSSIQGASTLDLDYNLTNPNGTLTLNGSVSKLILDQDLTFRAVTINGTPLSVGVHPFAELNAAFDANIVEGGTGNIIVVPEPSSAAFVFLAALGCGRTMRRCRLGGDSR